MQPTPTAATPSVEPSQRAALYARYDGPAPLSERAIAAFGSLEAFEVARSRNNVRFFRGHVQTSLRRIRRARMALADPTLSLAEVASMKDRLTAATVDMAFGLRQFRSYNRRCHALLRQQAVGEGQEEVEQPVRSHPRRHALPHSASSEVATENREIVGQDAASPIVSAPTPSGSPSEAAVSKRQLPSSMTPQERLRCRPTHTVDDGARFWLFRTHAEADAFARTQSRHNAGRVYTLSRLTTLGAEGRT